MDSNALIEAACSSWDRHQEILMALVDAVPRGGMAVVPLESRGRDVARQLAHLARVRQGWIAVHETGKRPDLPKADRDKRPTKAQLRKELRNTGKEVRAHLEGALRGEKKIRFFGKNPLRWMSYLIAHESHHRGSIMLAFKQAGVDLPEDLALKEMWGTWIHGED